MGNCGSKRNKTQVVIDDKYNKLVKKINKERAELLGIDLNKTDTSDEFKKKKDSKPKPYGRQTPTPPWFSETGEKKLLF